MTARQKINIWILFYYLLAYELQDICNFNKTTFGISLVHLINSIKTCLLNVSEKHSYDIMLR